MKKITLLFLMFVVSLGYSQEVQVLQDFEEGGLGETFGDIGSAMIVADPEAGGDRGMVAELITSAAGNVWQGTNIELNQNVLLNGADNLTMIVDVYSTTPISLAVKVVGSIDGGLDSTTSVDHAGNGWQSLIATFNTGQDNTVAANGTYAGFVVYPNWDPTTNTYITPPVVRTLYVDNIAGFVGGDVEPDVGPTTPAPTPIARNAAGVFSIYGDAYAQQPGVVFGAFDVGTQDLTDIEIAPGDDILKAVTTAAAGRNFIFADWGAPIDVSAMTNYHMDYWIQTEFTAGLVFDHKFSNHAGDAGESSAFQEVTPVVTLGEWVSIDIPISSFSIGSPNQIRDELRQYILTVAGADLNTRIVYLDNIYLYNDALSTDEFAAGDFRVYPNPTLTSWNIESKTTISSVTVYDILGKQVTRLTPNASAVEISTSNIKSGVYFARIQGLNGSKTVKLIKQ